MKKHPKDLTKGDYRGPGNMTEYLNTQVEEDDRKRRERNRKKSYPLEVETALDNGNEVESPEEYENIGLMNETFMQEKELEA